MIPARIRALFDFIDYLDANKHDYIKKYVPICEELYLLHDKRRILKPNQNYRDRKQYETLQSQIEEKFAPIKSEVVVPFLDKMEKLGIWSGDDAYASIWNNSCSEIFKFHSDAEFKDVEQVTAYKEKYVAFRNETDCNFLVLFIAFNSLDQVLRLLFDYFKETDENEFESFQAKAIEVHSLGEAIDRVRENPDTYIKLSIPSARWPDMDTAIPVQTTVTHFNNEIIMGDKIQARDISNNSGQVSFGKGNRTIVDEGDKDEILSKRSFNWQKWGIILGTILTIVAIVVAILFS
jgi:hypothetical protein